MANGTENTNDMEFEKEKKFRNINISVHVIIALISLLTYYYLSTVAHYLCNTYWQRKMNDERMQRI